MSTRKPQEVPQPIAAVIDENRVPAAVTFEFGRQECEVVVGIEAFSERGVKEGEVREVACELTKLTFRVVAGQLVYTIRIGDGGLLTSYLHPSALARGEAFIKERLLHMATLERDRARYRLMEAVRLEAAAALPVRFDLPGVVQEGA